MTNYRNQMIAILVSAGCLIPPIALALASRVVPGFDIGTWYRPDASATLPAASFTLGEQLIICIAAFGLKPVYEFIALILIVRLWNQESQEMIALRYGLIAFLLGENACALNYMLFKENSFIFEYLHIYGMLVCFAFVFYAILKTLDRRIFKYSHREEKCAFLFFCQKCYKYHPVSCTIKRLYQLFIIAAAIITFMPMTAALGGYFVEGDVFGSSTIFGHSLAQQILETRILPILGVFFLVFSCTILHLKKENGFETAKVLLSAALGLLGFSLMRFLIFWGFEHNPIWADIWEEITEFLFIASVYFLLFLSRENRTKMKSG